MKSAYIITGFLFLNPCFILAQRHDNTWMLGYYTAGGEEFGITQCTFNDGNLLIQKDTTFKAVFIDNNVVYSDSDGDYFASFNGFRLYDSSRKKMLNGDSIWYETLPYLYGYSDDDLPQGGMFLPWPGRPDSILLFYISQGNCDWPDWLDLCSLNLYYALIEKSGNNGLGKVTERRVEIISDSIQYGQVNAVKHANGQDWWIIVCEKDNNRFYRLLIDNYGIHKLDSQIIGLPVIQGLGQTVFSPDGKFYVIKNSVSSTTGNFLDIYNFDRCTGYLSNHQQIHYPGSALGGVAISPNSRYLYVSFRTTLYQYDLYSDDLEGSKVLIGEFEPDTVGFPATFYTMQLAPDNKIYMCATNGVKILHVIHNPDEPGVNCNFQQRGIKLPVHNSTALSYSPYYRLGPLDGSLCDTLGLDNIPVAWWRYEQDTLDSMLVYFTDLSYYEPATWSWDFGDGSPGSSERHPVRQFDPAGMYQVCLTVSNAKGTHTHCKPLYLGVSSQDNPALQTQVQVSPNPFRGRLTVTLSARLRSPVFRLYDMTGRLALQERIALGVNEVETEDLAPGFYVWAIMSGNERVRTGKCIKPVP